MMADGSGKANAPSPAPEHPLVKRLIGIFFLAGLLLFLFWPVVKYLVSLVLG